MGVPQGVVVFSQLHSLSEWYDVAHNCTVILAILFDKTDAELGIDERDSIFKGEHFSWKYELLCAVIKVEGGLPVVSEGDSYSSLSLGIFKEVEGGVLCYSEGVQ